MLNFKLSRSPFKPLGWVLRCLLVCAAWQGPVPYAHSHCSLVGSRDRQFSSSMEHLHHRATVGTDADAHSGWHLHVSLPVRKGTAPSDLQHEQEVPLLNFESSQSLTDPLVRSAQLISWLSAPAQQTCRATIAPDVCIARTHFFDSFAPTLPLPLRFSILRS